MFGAKALGFRTTCDKTARGAWAIATIRPVGAEMLRVVFFARNSQHRPDEVTFHMCFTMVGRGGVDTGSSGVL